MSRENVSKVTVVGGTAEVVVLAVEDELKAVIEDTMEVAVEYAMMGEVKVEEIK